MCLTATLSLTAALFLLQGMPPPLPGCVWGLPMLPPPMPGFGSNAMMMPATAMVPSRSFSQPASNMPWPQDASTGTTMHGGAMRGQPWLQGSAPLPGATFAAPAGVPNANAAAAVKGVSSATWSQEPATTGFDNMQWHDVDMLAFDDGADEEALHRFGEELLAVDDDAAAVATGISFADSATVPGGKIGGGVAGGAASVGAGGGDKSGFGDDDVGDGLGGDTLSWMEDTYLLDEGLGDKSGLYLEMMA